MQSKSHKCEISELEEKEVRGVLKDLADKEKFLRVAELFKVMSDPTRVKILSCLLKHPLGVCDIANLLGASHSAISHQLRVLRYSHLVKYRRRGRKVIYSIGDDHVRTLLAQAMEHISEERG